LYKEHDDGRPNGVPADDEQGTDDLEPDLAAVAVDCAAGVGVAEACDARGCGEDAG